MPRYTKTLTDLLRRGGVFTAMTQLSGGRRGLPVINNLRKIYPQLSLQDIGKLYQIGLRDTLAAQRTTARAATRRPTLRGIPVRSNLPISEPGVNRVRYDVRVHFKRGSLRKEQVTTIYVDSPRPLRDQELKDAIDRGFWAQVGTLGGSPPFLPGESITVTKTDVFSVFRTH